MVFTIDNGKSIIIAVKLISEITQVKKQTISIFNRVPLGSITFVEILIDIQQLGIMFCSYLNVAV
jgi:hypothetical protein